LLPTMVCCAGLRVRCPVFKDEQIAMFRFCMTKDLAALAFEVWLHI